MLTSIRFMLYLNSSTEFIKKKGGEKNGREI